MITRPQTMTPHPLNIVGSSTFGRYPKISIEKTYNMFQSDNFMVDYAGYEIGINASELGDSTEGRALFASSKLNRLVGVFGNKVYLINVTFSQRLRKVTTHQAIEIGVLQTSTGIVYISQNNKPQILISDNTSLYLYDPAVNPVIQIVSTNFIPGYIDFHDTYFLCAAKSDGLYTPPANNTWRLSASNDGSSWPDDAASVGLLETKPDNTQAVVRFPSKGNMIFVFGRTVAEPWFDVGYQLFPYQRNTSYNCDYGCINPATIAAMDDLVVWLAINEKGGPVVMYSDGGPPVPITTDGFDSVIENMQSPEDSEAFFYRQDGHLFYHINFFTDNLSFYVDFLKDGSHKIYHACDENGNYFIASRVAFFNNQYYFITRNNGNLYAFDTVFTTFDGKQAPRIRVCRNIRNLQQEAFVANDCGFTIESGNTDYLPQTVGPLYLCTEEKYARPFTFITEDNNCLITEDGNQLASEQYDFSDTYCAPSNKYITEGDVIFLETEDEQLLVSEDNINLISEQIDPTTFFYLIAQQPEVVQLVPHVDLSISIDGGEHFSSYDTIYLPPIGERKNKLAWWQLGWANDLVCQFRFHSLGRFVATDGVVNVRQ